MERREENQADAHIKADERDTRGRSTEKRVEEKKKKRAETEKKQTWLRSLSFRTTRLPSYGCETLTWRFRLDEKCNWDRNFGALVLLANMPVHCNGSLFAWSFKPPMARRFIQRSRHVFEFTL